MSVGKRDDTPTVKCRDEVQLGAWRGVDLGRAVNPQPGNAPIRVNVDAQMGPQVVVRASQEIMAVGIELVDGQDFRPFRRLIRGAGAPPALDPASGRVVAGEVRGIDVETIDPTRRGQSDGRVVVAPAAPPPGLPAVHPLAVVVIEVGVEDRRAVGEHAFQRCEEFIGGRQPARAKPG